MNKITWQDCGKMYFTRETNPDTGEVIGMTAELIGNPIISMSDELREEADPRWFVYVSQGVYDVAGFRLTFLQDGDIRNSFWKVDRIKSDE